VAAVIDGMDDEEAGRIVSDEDLGRRIAQRFGVTTDED
jgi:hypothetical protein